MYVKTFILNERSLKKKKKIIIIIIITTSSFSKIMNIAIRSKYFIFCRRNKDWTDPEFNGLLILSPFIADVNNLLLMLFLSFSIITFLLFVSYFSSSFFFHTVVSANVKQSILHCLLVERCIIVV